MSEEKNVAPIVQKLLKSREQKVRCDATVPASMLRHRYTSARNLLTNLCFHIVREEAVLPIQLLLQIRDKLLQALFCESLLNPNFEFGSANLRLRRHIKHYDKHARKVSYRFCISVNERKQKSEAYAPLVNITLPTKGRLRYYKLFCKLSYLSDKTPFLVFQLFTSI